MIDVPIADEHGIVRSGLVGKAGLLVNQELTFVASL